MTPQDYASACEATARRALGPLGLALGTGMAANLPPKDITTPLRLAHFLAQASHETEGFRYLTELGGAAYFHRYDGWRDLGNTQPGDGARFCGRGIFQITGRANYAKYGKAIGVDLIANPALAAEPANAVATAAVYWDAHNLNALADVDHVVGITRAINGGLNGLADRESALVRAKTHLGVQP